MRIKKERMQELSRLRLLRDDLHHQVILKESEIIELKKQARLSEIDLAELQGKVEKLEQQQSAVKKVEEFNALTHEISALEREKAAKEQRLSDQYDKLSTEEDLLKNLKATYEASKSNTEQLEQEIKESIASINAEGSVLFARREELLPSADPELLQVYEKLLKNKKDRVVVPIENRCCSGCHVLVTAQHENIVRKGEKIVFCEHCSRIHYWLDSFAEEDVDPIAPKRRKKATVSK
jgi:hypothetical protein